MQQGEPQGQHEAPERLAGPLAPQAGRATGVVANGPCREKVNSPRDRKRRQQAARGRDKEQKDIPYWQRNRGTGGGELKRRLCSVLFILIFVLFQINLAL